MATATKNQLPELAVITGAGNGIGKALAFYCAERDIHLILLDVNETNLNQTKQAISTSYPNIKTLTFVMDVTNNQKLRETVLPSLETNKIAAKYNIKYLFNCAGILDLYASLTDPSAQHRLHRTMNINFWGYVYMIQCFLPYLDQNNLKNMFSYIINISSVAGVASGWDIYCVSKSAVCSYSEALYRELRKLKKNIKVLIVCPGHIKTDILNNTKGLSEGGTDGQSKLMFNEKKIGKEIAKGMSPKQLCEIIFDGIRKNKFYVKSEEMGTYISAKAKFNSVITGDFSECTRKKYPLIYMKRMKELKAKM